MDPLLFLVFAVLMVVILGWHEQKKLVFGLSVVLIGLMVWLDMQGDGEEQTPQRMKAQEEKRRVFEMLVTVDLEDQAQKLYNSGLDSLEKLSNAPMSAATVAGIKPVHWRHINLAARKALNLPELTNPVPTPPPATPAPVTTLAPGSQHHVLQPGGASQEHITTIVNTDSSKSGTLAGPSKPLRSLKPIPGAVNTEKKEIPGGVQKRSIPGGKVPAPDEKPVPVGKPVPVPVPVGKPSIPGAIPVAAEQAKASESLDDLLTEVTKKKVLVSLKKLQEPTPAPAPTEAPKKTGLIVLLEAATPGPDSFTCTFDAGYGELGAEVGETAEVKRVESMEEAEALGEYTLLVKDPVIRMANMLKRFPPDCLYPNVTGNQPRRSPLETFTAATSEQRVACEELYNRMTKILSRQPFGTPATKEHYEEALQTLSKIKRILVQESIESSMEMLQRTQTEIRTYITCAQHLQTPRKTIPPEVLTALEEANQFDTQLYLHAARMFEATVNKARGNVRPAEAPCEGNYTPVCWDGSQPHSEARKVEKDNVQDLLTCNEQGCKAARGRDIVCSVKRCKLRDPKRPASG